MIRLRIKTFTSRSMIASIVLVSGSAYGSLELRVKLFEVKSYFLPGPLGITGFYDIGRVWLKGESSRIWHSAYGGGVYFVPFNKFMVSASVGFAAQERLFNVTLGTKVNLTF